MASDIAVVVAGDEYAIVIVRGAANETIAKRAAYEAMLPDSGQLPVADEIVDEHTKTIVVTEVNVEPGVPIEHIVEVAGNENAVVLVRGIMDHELAKRAAYESIYGAGHADCPPAAIHWHQVKYSARMILDISAKVG